MKMKNDKLRYMFWCGILIAIGVYLLGNFEREKIIEWPPYLMANAIMMGTILMI